MFYERCKRFSLREVTLMTRHQSIDHSYHINHPLIQIHHTSYHIMSESQVIVKTRKLMRNPLLNRRQMVIDIVHPGVASVSRNQVREILAKKLKAKDEKAIIIYGIRILFGGVRSTGFANVYDSIEDCKKVEPAYKLVRHGVVEKKEKKGRKGIKEAKNKAKKIWGTVKKHNVSLFDFIIVID